MAGMGGANIAGAAMGGVSALMKLGLGIKQLIDGKKIQKRLDAQGRPIETTPQAFKETEGLVRSNYLDPRFMGEDEMRQAIEARGANQIQNIQQTAGSGADALMAYNVANNNSNKQLVDLGFKAADQQQQDYQQLLSTLGQKAGYEQSQFQNNVMAPYMQQAQQAQALKQSGLTNMGNAFNDGGCVMVAYELFKKDNGYKETSVRAVKDQDGNTVYLPIKEVFFGKQGGVLRGTYMQTVNKALNYNHKQRKKDYSKTQPVVVIINKLAGMRQREKDRVNLKVNSFIINRKLPIERDFNEKEINSIKKTINTITSGSK